MESKRFLFVRGSIGKIDGKFEDFIFRDAHVHDCICICIRILLHFWMSESAIESRIGNIHQHPLVQPLHTPFFERDIYSQLQWLSFLGLHILRMLCWNCWTVAVWHANRVRMVPPLKRLALTSPTISSSTSRWSLISSAKQPHWRTVANPQLSLKNIRPWRTNTGAFRQWQEAWCFFWLSSGSSANGELLVWGLVVWDFFRGTPKNPNPFQKGIPFGIQTTGPQTNNQPLAEECFCHLLPK